MTICWSVSPLDRPFYNYQMIAFLINMLKLALKSLIATENPSAGSYPSNHSSSRTNVDFGLNV